MRFDFIMVNIMVMAIIVIMVEHLRTIIFRFGQVLTFNFIRVFKWVYFFKIWV